MTKNPKNKKFLKNSKVDKKFLKEKEYFKKKIVQ